MNGLDRICTDRVFPETNKKTKIKSQAHIKIRGKDKYSKHQQNQNIYAYVFYVWHLQ